MRERIAQSTQASSRTVSQSLGVVTGVLFLFCFVVGLESASPEKGDPALPQELEHHLVAIAELSQPSPMVKIPAGWFLMGTVRKDDDPFGLETQYDDTEFPQRRIWLDAYSLDRDEVSMAEYVAFFAPARSSGSAQTSPSDLASD